MGALRIALRRAGTVAATVTAISLAGTSMASAHHCYKNYWQPNAYAHHVNGGTAWMPLSDMGTMYLIGPEYAEQCGWVADQAVADFMRTHGLTQEPLIHSRATVGSGAAYQGKTVKPFSYLSEEDFGELTMAVVAGMSECAPEWQLPEGG